MSLPHSPSGGTSLHTVTNGGFPAGSRRVEGQFTSPRQRTPAAPGPRSSMVPTALQPRLSGDGANAPTTPATTEPWPQPSRPLPLSTGARCGLPLLATAPLPEPGPRLRTQPKPAKPAPKPRPTLPLALQKKSQKKNIGTLKNSTKDEREGYITHPAPPAAKAGGCQWSNRRTDTRTSRCL